MIGRVTYRLLWQIRLFMALFCRPNRLDWRIDPKLRIFSTKFMFTFRLTAINVRRNCKNTVKNWSWRLIFMRVTHGPASTELPIEETIQINSDQHVNHKRKYIYRKLGIFSTKFIFPNWNAGTTKRRNKVGNHRHRPPPAISNGGRCLISIDRPIMSLTFFFTFLWRLFYVSFFFWFHK